MAIVLSDEENLVASTGFFVLRPKAFSSEVNLVLMKSSLMQEFLRRTARGMILSATTQGDFKRLLVPRLGQVLQDKITERVIASHEARARSKMLLDNAKRAVEIFVEQDEQAALKSLEGLMI